MGRASFSSFGPATFLSKSQGCGGHVEFGFLMRGFQRCIIKSFESEIRSPILERSDPTRAEPIKAGSRNR
jgi:hypothetical protein